ncbi:MAG TPA: nucleoside triphosphate pyrophosphatase [Oligoflexia bacterium]|nr:nucleoside triphosphate pyrophosphatase [Oligoflexia bacterium]HMP26721.1 nucleoside triphosphate pyrophosphatase [Oligoflexia bacterium]
MFKVKGNNRIILASLSPRRREMMGRVNLPVLFEAPDIDETPLPNEHPRNMASRLALEKAAAVGEKWRDAFVIACDTTVALGEKNFSKPESKDRAIDFLLKLSGKTHQVYTAHAIFCKARGVKIEFCDENLVTFAEISKDLAKIYADTGEPLDKSGAYALQGKASVFIKEIKGSCDSVIGMNLQKLIKSLLELGVIEVDL